MSGPLIPYVQLPEIPLTFLRHLPLLGELVDPKHPPSIKPFGTLVALGVYFGTLLAMKRAKERGHDPKETSDFLFWTVATGFVLSHMLDAVTYHPDTVLRDPLYLIKIWDGLSSMGGFIGAVVGAYAWKLYRRKPILELVEMAVYGMPLAWVFGRTGCSVVHDHPGILSDAWFAVRFPLRGGGYVGRLDLGLIEMVLTIPLAVAMQVLWKRRPNRPVGFYIAVVCLYYAPIRFVLDFLRVPSDEAILGADERYVGLTPAQWATFAMLATGIYFALKLRKGTAAPLPAAAAVAPASAAASDAGPVGDAPSSGAQAEPPEPAADAASPPAAEPATKEDQTEGGEPPG